MPAGSREWGIGSNFYPPGTIERVTETGGMILIIVKGPPVNFLRILPTEK